MIAMPMPEPRHLPCFVHWTDYKNICHHLRPALPDRGMTELVYGEEYGVEWEVSNHYREYHMRKLETCSLCKWLTQVVTTSSLFPIQGFDTSSCMERNWLYLPSSGTSPPRQSPLWRVFGRVIKRNAELRRYVYVTPSGLLRLSLCWRNSVRLLL